MVASFAIGSMPKPTVLIKSRALGHQWWAWVLYLMLRVRDPDERVGSGGGEIGVEKVERRSAGERPRRRVVAAS